MESSQDRCAAYAGLMITKRRLTPELMDDPAVDPSELAHALRYLRLVNRRLGGTGLVLQAFDRIFRTWPKNDVIRVLDVATGSADIPIALAQWARKRGLRIEITGVDLHAATLEVARRQTQGWPNITLLEQNALRLAEHFEPGSFHVVHAGLFLHHLHDLEVMTMLRIMQRLSSRAVLWNDLVRSPLTLLGVRAVAWPAPRIARHDAIVSMQAAFTKREALELARRVGLERVTYRRRWFYRFLLRSEHPPPAGGRAG